MSSQKIRTLRHLHTYPFPTPHCDYTHYATTRWFCYVYLYAVRLLPHLAHSSRTITRYTPTAELATPPPMPIAFSTYLRSYPFRLPHTYTPYPTAVPACLTPPPPLQFSPYSAFMAVCVAVFVCTQHFTRLGSRGAPHRDSFAFGFVPRTTLYAWFSIYCCHPYLWRLLLHNRRCPRNWLSPAFPITYTRSHGLSWRWLNTVPRITIYLHSSTTYRY